jgi:hypothetical protein
MFDQRINITNVVVWSTTDCADEAGVTELANCRMQTQPAASPDETLGAEVIAGIVVALIVAIICGIAVGIVIRRRELSDIHIMETAAGPDDENGYMPGNAHLLVGSMIDKGM